MSIWKEEVHRVSWLALFLCMVIVYGIIPTVVIRQTGAGIYKRGKHTKAVALTFDDGPNPYYTPQLLDLLKKHGIKATFFLVGTKAKQYPQLVKRMHEDGHDIGLHNYRHISNWFIFPPFLQRGLRKSADVIEQITGERPIYYRPPWGHFNLCMWTVQKKYVTVMWTAILGDWKENLGVATLVQRLKKSLKDGAIIVLHDSGETLGADKKAPEHMIQALQQFFEDEAAKNAQWVTISEMIDAQTNGQIRAI